MKQRNDASGQKRELRNGEEQKTRQQEAHWTQANEQTTRREDELNLGGDKETMKGASEETRTQTKREAAMVSEAVRRSTSCSGCGVNGEGGVHAKVVPRASHARRCAPERQTVRGSGAKSTGAAKSLAPARYWPIMKIMWAAVTRTAQSILICPSMADRVEPEACQPTAVSRRGARARGAGRGRR